jgi:hypothetical protein
MQGWGVGGGGGGGRGGGGVRGGVTGGGGEGETVSLRLRCVHEGEGPGHA